MKPAFVLRRNNFRDNSLLLDLLTQDEGRISAVARYSKKQAARIKGMLEPFRLLDASWTGRGEVFTLTQTEEKGRYRLQQGALVQGLYLNELFLRTFQTQQPIPELFQRYREVLHTLQAGENLPAVMLLELELLASCGYSLNLWQDDHEGAAILEGISYRFRPEFGLVSADELLAEPNDTLISGALLVALRTPEQMPLIAWRELRLVLDRLWRVLLKGKTLYARQLLTELR
ncbi:MAG: DNA repair protein RecO [Thiothrix sp.]|nr:MAG: DNA repair protein RecO [Thiothrix sp.]